MYYRLEAIDNTCRTDRGVQLDIPVETFELQKLPEMIELFTKVLGDWGVALKDVVWLAYKYRLLSDGRIKRSSPYLG